MTSPRDFTYWEERYRAEPVESMPWYFEPLDPDVASALKEFNIPTGSVLDIGSGPGTQAIELAKQGFTVTASDISAHAIEQLKERAVVEKIQLNCVQDDILNSEITEKFSLFIDRGCFHVLPPEKRARYVHQLKQKSLPGAFLLLKCFSDLEPREDGPYRLSPDNLREIFEPYFKVLKISHTVYQGTNPVLPKALFAVLRTNVPA